MRVYARNGLRYFGTAYQRLRSGAWTPPRPEEEEAKVLLNGMTTMAHVMALVEGATSDHAALEAREAIVEQYLREVEDEPWTPEEGKA